jgi:hypothetical protein
VLVFYVSLSFSDYSVGRQTGKQWNCAQMKAKETGL